MDYTDIYRSSYMKADDLNDRTAKRTIVGCTAEKVGEDERLVFGVFRERQTSGSKQNERHHTGGVIRP